MVDPLGARGDRDRQQSGQKQRRDPCSHTEDEARGLRQRRRSGSSGFLPGGSC
jgi:hypothetical protein